VCERGGEIKLFLHFSIMSLFSSLKGKILGHPPSILLSINFSILDQVLAIIFGKTNSMLCTSKFPVIALPPPFFLPYHFNFPSFSKKFGPTQRKKNPAVSPPFVLF
jgi:hypothetical protein